MLPERLDARADVDDLLLAAEDDPVEELADRGELLVDLQKEKQRIRSLLPMAKKCTN